MATTSGGIDDDVDDEWSILDSIVVCISVAVDEDNGWCWWLSLLSWLWWSCPVVDESVDKTALTNNNMGRNNGSSLLRCCVLIMRLVFGILAIGSVTIAIMVDPSREVDILLFLRLALDGEPPSVTLVWPAVSAWKSNRLLVSMLLWRVAVLLVYTMLGHPVGNGRKGLAMMCFSLTLRHKTRWSPW